VVNLNDGGTFGKQYLFQSLKYFDNVEKL
jgi:hypothetical protein